MSHYLVIAKVSQRLRSLLWEDFRQDPVITQYVSALEDIVFTNPVETARQSANRLSLWLYQITENEFVKNQPLLRAERNGDRGVRATAQFLPLALNLFYLVTPFATVGAPDPPADQILLGKTMQVLYDNAVILLRDPTPQETVMEELRVIFCRLTLEELTRIWEALQEPYRLSVCYQVRVTRIDSQRRLDQTRVVERTAGVTDQVAEAQEGAP
jgi:Pvc16 N-terminal domain